MTRAERIADVCVLIAAVLGAAIGFILVSMNAGG